MKENAYTILSTFSTATMKGIRFYFIQLFIGIAIELLVSLLGIKLYWGKFGIWAIFLEICILTYTMIYSWFYAFVSLKYHGLKTAIIPYALYIGCIYLGIAAANSWNFKTVTIDDLTTWWLDPIYGFFVLILKVMTKKKLHSYPRFLNRIKKVLNIFIIIYILIYVLAFIFLWMYLKSII